ncbi:hypothetical protein NQZ79_g7531 [Umbelopsis isabellina]|nr:hypothetical protein NQZ79_g7531 [Umbelopsis isabellina]
MPLDKFQIPELLSTLLSLAPVAAALKVDNIDEALVSQTLGFFQWWISCPINTALDTRTVMTSFQKGLKWRNLKAIGVNNGNEKRARHNVINNRILTIIRENTPETDRHKNETIMLHCDILPAAKQSGMLEFRQRYMLGLIGYLGIMLAMIAFSIVSSSWWSLGWLTVTVLQTFLQFLAAPYISTRFAYHSSKKRTYIVAEEWDSRVMLVLHGPANAIEYGIDSDLLIVNNKYPPVWWIQIIGFLCLSAASKAAGWELVIITATIILLYVHSRIFTSSKKEMCSRWCCQHWNIVKRKEQPKPFTGRKAAWLATVLKIDQRDRRQWISPIVPIGERSKVLLRAYDLAKDAIKDRNYRHVSKLMLEIFEHLDDPRAPKPLDIEDLHCLYEALVANGLKDGGWDQIKNAVTH